MESLLENNAFCQGKGPLPRSKVVNPSSPILASHQACLNHDGMEQNGRLLESNLADQAHVLREVGSSVGVTSFAKEVASAIWPRSSAADQGSLKSGHQGCNFPAAKAAKARLSSKSEFLMIG